VDCTCSELKRAGHGVELDCVELGLGLDFHGSNRWPFATAIWDQAARRLHEQVQLWSCIWSSREIVRAQIVAFLAMYCTITHMLNMTVMPLDYRSIDRCNGGITNSTIQINCTYKL